MSAISLRGINDEIKQRLKSEAAKAGISVNALILEYIQKGIGLKSEQRKVYKELDRLAGTWDENDAEEFLKSISAFSNIDNEIWQ
jgi:plasmid stability protein